MKAEWSKDWKSSIKPRKQRKYRYNAPLHIKQDFMHVHLDKELRKKYGTRAIQVRKGDTVKMVRGQYHKKTGKVSRVMLKRQKVFIEGIENIKKDGTTTLVALQPSNMVITSLNLEDKKRKAKLEKKPTKTEEKK